MELMAGSLLFNQSSLSDIKILKSFSNSKVKNFVTLYQTLKELVGTYVSRPVYRCASPV